MDTLFVLPTSVPPHPAKYTDILLAEFVKMLGNSNCVLDPFGGTGKVFLLNRWYPNMKIYATEIELEWARTNKRTINADALHLPFATEMFDAICTSPTYGNRMADKLPESGKYERQGYADKLGRNLHQNNSGAMQWGNSYKDFHVAVWKEATRVLSSSGIFVLNIKNHIRSGVEQLVTEWHIETLESLGYKLLEHTKINTPSMRYGRNGDKRIEYESVIKFSKRSRP